uniref:Hydrocephalus-inducing protein-like n=1 Tax=Diabrotica virgifera virgifera TaxID=50390 RepID=A0A6P7GMI0_DIAVI
MVFRNKKKGTTSTLSLKNRSKKDINKKANKSLKKDDRAPSEYLPLTPKPTPWNAYENFHIYPSKPVKIDSNKKYEFIVEFKPLDRNENYSTKIYYKIFDYIGLLSSIKGKCVVPEFSLDQNLLTFCNVLVGHERTNTLLLNNTGDFGIKFKWDHEGLTNFKIIPTEGYLAASSKLQIMFTFKCDSVGQIIRKGLLILPLDDKEIIYSLVGTAVAPLPEKKIWIEIRAKYSHSQILQIRNWTNNKICCQVETVLKSIPTLKTLYKVSGLETVDIRPNEVKGYEWNVYIINEEVLDFNVDLEILYLPIKPGVSTPVIEASCNELGSISYPFKLIARPPPREKPVKFVAELGFGCFEKAVIQNTFSSSLELNATFAHAEFSMEKTTTILPGEIGTIRIKFEPSSLGLVESELTLTSSVSGAYIFPLFGKCIPPTPKGPFTIKRGTPTPISFFNPFTYAETFYYDIDNKMFQAKLESEEVKGRQSTKIMVTHPKSGLDVAYPITGKLTVTRKNTEDDKQKETVKWSFYLQTDK